MKKASILIPCYNEEGNIAECLRQIPRMPWETEIIVVDDGSTDRTAQIARESRVPCLTVIRQEMNQGKGAALRAGLKHARGDVVVVCDADYTSPPSEIPRILGPILEGKADFVTGTRFLFPMEKNAMTFLNRISNQVSAFLVSRYLGTRITDSLCGLKAWKRDLLKGELRENSWPDYALFVLAKKSDLRIAETPIHYRARKTGLSKMNTSRKFYRMPLLLVKGLLGKS